jgi:hypothetical protein
MPMVRHQAIAEDASLRPLDRLLSDPFKGLVIARHVKQRHPSHAPIEDVVNNSPVGLTQPPRHPDTLSKPSRRANK